MTLKRVCVYICYSFTIESNKFIYGEKVREYSKCVWVCAGINTGFSQKKLGEEESWMRRHVGEEF